MGFTEEDLQRMKLDQEKEKHETLHDVPLELCLQNSFEPTPEQDDPLPKRDLNGVPIEIEEPDVVDYIGDRRIGHIFIARRRPDNNVELLGSNLVLRLAKKQGVKALGTVCVADYDDAKWLKMSRFSQDLTLSRMLWFYQKGKELNLDPGLRAELVDVAARWERLDKLGLIHTPFGSGCPSLIIELNNNLKNKRLIPRLTQIEDIYEDSLSMNSKGERQSYR